MGQDEHEERVESRVEERRAHPRYAVEEDAVLLVVSHGLPVKARLTDLSAEGCRVRALEPFAAKVGRTIEISFKVKGFAFRFCGLVRWTDGHHLFGISFENILSRRKTELEEVIEEMAAAVRRQAVNQAVAEQAVANQPVAKQQAPSSTLPIPTGDSAARRAEAAAAPAAEKALETPAQQSQRPAAETKTEAAPPAKARDRRAQARHELNTTATILLVKVASALRGRIVDLSMGGCRILTDDKFPVGIYTRVEIEFHLQGLPFRLGGVVQAIHNRTTVGIRFLDFSERKRQQVQDLIEEIDAETAHDEKSPEQEQP